MTHERLLIWIPVLAALLQGCRTHTPTMDSEERVATSDAGVDFNDPVLNNRQLLLFGPIDQQAAERTIQKLLFLDAKSHEPIDLFLQTPGGEFKGAMAIERVMSILQSPVNTYALSECNSGGALLLAAGTGKRRAFPGALIVLHGLKVSGRPPEGFVNRVQDAYTEFWRERTRLPAAWLPLPPGAFRVLSAEQALEYGIIDEVVRSNYSHPEDPAR